MSRPDDNRTHPPTFELLERRTLFAGTGYEPIASPGPSPGVATGAAPAITLAPAPAVTADSPAYAEYRRRLLAHAAVLEHYHLDKKITDGREKNDTTVGEWQLHAERIFQYDAARVYWEAYRLTGDARWRDDARRITDRYVNGYVNDPDLDFPGVETPGLDRVKARINFLEGLRIDYQETGDPARRLAIKNAVREIVAHGQFVRSTRPVDFTRGYQLEDNGDTRDTVRINSRVMEALLDARLVNPEDPPAYFQAGVSPPVDAVRTMADQLLGQLEQFGDGSYNRADPRIDPPYFWLALAGKAVLRYLREWPGAEADRGRALSAMTSAADRVWSDGWKADDQAFKYSPRLVNDDGNGNTHANPALNMMISAWFAELYRVTGEARFRDRARAAYEPAVTGSDIGSETVGPPLEDDPTTVDREDFDNTAKRWREYGWYTPDPAVVTNVTTVARVYVNGTGWSTAFRDRLRQLGLGDVARGWELAPNSPTAELPWSGVDQVTVRFTGPVNVEQGDLRVSGLRVPAYAFKAFAYDPATFTATWTLAAPLAGERARLELPFGAVADAASQPLPALWQWLDVLPGDANRDDRVNAVDTALVRARQLSGATRGGYTPFADVNGDGRINAVDLGQVRANQLGTLPDARASAQVLGRPGRRRTDRERDET